MIDHKPEAEFFKKLKKETSMFSKFQGIYNKAEKEGYLHCIHLTFSNIFEKEIKFVISGWLNRDTPIEIEKQRHCHRKPHQIQLSHFQWEPETDFGFVEFLKKFSSFSKAS